MRHEPIGMDVKKASGGTSGDGAALAVDRFIGKTIQVSGTFVGTVQPQGSINGTDWYNLGSGLTAPGIVYVDDTVNHAHGFLRMQTTAYTSGTPVATFAGYDVRAA